MNITGKAKLAGVAGWPVGHSLSPLLHNFWLENLAVDGAYVPLAIAPHDLARALDGLFRAGFVGVNLTIPHKEAGFALADRLDDHARAAGAVNLLLRGPDGRLEGRNTDASGLAASLRAGGVTLSGGKAVLCGAGGAARAAVLALAEIGAAEITVLNRHEDRANQLVRALAPHVTVKLESRGFADWPGLAAETALLVTATSAGMAGNPPLALTLDSLRGSAAVCDLVYSPLATPLLKTAVARGHKIVDGLGMLLHQAVPAFEAFYGIRPEVTPALRQKLEHTLRAKQKQA